MANPKLYFGFAKTYCEIADSDISNRQRHQVFPQVHFSSNQADDCAKSPPFIRNSVQHIKFRSHPRLRHGGHFDLNRMKYLSFLND